MDFLKVAFRQLMRDKRYSFITILGLALGLTCGFAIMLFISEELSYDRYHQKSELIFRLIQGGDNEEQGSSLPFPTGPTLQHDFPDLVKQSVRLFNFQASSLAITVDDQSGLPQAHNEPRFFFADSTYFEVFDHTFLAGNPQAALMGPNMVVITRSTALRYFHTTDAVGKYIRFEGRHDLEVSGVVEDVPANSHFKWDFIASISSLPALGFPIPEKNWYWNPVWTYVLLKNSADRSTLLGQLPNFVQKYYHPSLRDDVTLNLQPLTDIYLHSRADYEIAVMSTIKHVKLFGLIGIFIILVACINFINLTTAKATDRFKEIGVRKTAGADRMRLVFQFLTESVLISVISLIVAIVVVSLILPYLNQLSGKEFTLQQILRFDRLLMIAAVALITGLISGLYPALYLSSLKPSLILKSQGGGPSGKARLRKILTVFQFAVSTILIIGTIILYQQIQFMKGASLGFDQDQVVVLPVQRLSVVKNYESFKGQLLTNSIISHVSTSNTLLGKDYQSSNYSPKGEEELSLHPCLFVRNDFLATLDIPLKAGRDFSQLYTAAGNYAIINEALCKAWGWKDPEDAINKKFLGTLEGEITIVGVAADFHYASLKETIGPLVMIQGDHIKNRDFFTRFVYVRINKGQLPEGLAFLEKTWKQFVTESPFDYFFLDSRLDSLYKKEEQTNTIVTVFSCIAIIIGCLGLYGVAIFSFRKRKREVALRKVLGASERSIAQLFVLDFLALVVIGFVVGSPIAFYLVQQWLTEYTYRVPVSVWVFAASLGTLMLIAFVTTVFQTIKAASANPSTVLRNE